MKRTLWVIALFLLAISAKSQDKGLYAFDKIENTIRLDITKISLFTQRMHLIYMLNNDDRFVVSTSDDDGFYIIRRNKDSYDFNLEDTFNSFFDEEKAAFNSISKDEVGELYSEWKSSLPNAFVASMMMDFYVQSRQNNHCADADPFCTDNGQYQFPAGVNAGSGESGPYYGCLSTTPNPAWYYMRMANPGAMTIHMYSTPSEDIDFCCWGPFDDPVTPCPAGLTQNKIVSCSYSTAATENCQIPSSAQTGQYYILIITNYSNHACNITFSKTSGTGTTDCSIMPPLVENGGPYCVGETIRLTGNAQSGATYNWSGPGNWNATGQTVTRPNCTINMAGTYTCTITLNGQSSSADTQVSVFANPIANFNVPSATAGSPVQFTSTSTTNPTGQPITSYLWNFGDNQTSTQQNPTHTYAAPGNYTVSLTVACGQNTCTNTKTATITVQSSMTTNISGTNVVCQNEEITLHANVAGGTGTYTYTWKKNGTVVGGNSPTLNLNMPDAGNFTFTCDIYDGYTTQSPSMNVLVNALPNANAGPDQSVNYENSATLTAAQVDGASYAWEPVDKIDGNPNQRIVHTKPLQATTTFTVTVTKTSCVSSDQVIVSVGAQMMASATISDAVICDGNSAHLTATATGGNGTYTYEWQAIPNTVTFSNPNSRETDVLPTQHGDYVFTCVVNDGQTTLNPQVNLTVNPAESEETTIAVCPSELPYILELPNGSTEAFNEGTGPNGWHTTVPNEFGCNVNVSLYLTVNEVVENEFSFETCDEPYTFIDNGEVIKTLYNTCVFDTVYPYGECEKHVTINFTRHTVYNESNHDQYVSINYPEHHCDSYTWPSNGQTYTQRGEYPHIFSTIHGCDSIVTLVLDEGNFSFEVDPGASSAMVVDTCKRYDVCEGCYIWGIEDQHTEIWASGNDWQYTFLGASSHGCDSIGHLRLRLYEVPSIGSMSGDQLVQPGVVYMPNLYEYQVLDISGAGTENDYPPTADDFTWDVLCYYNTPNRVNPYNPNDHQSTWLLDYPDPTDKSHVYLMINAEGNAVLKCTIHTICGDVTIDKFIYTEGYHDGESTDEINYDNMVNVFPNPTNGEIYIGYSQMMISEPLTITIYNCSGAMIDQFYGNTDSTVTKYATDDMPDGMYFVRLTGNNFVVTKKFVLSR